MWFYDGFHWKHFIQSENNLSLIIKLKSTTYLIFYFFLLNFTNDSKLSLWFPISFGKHPFNWFCYFKWCVYVFDHLSILEFPDIFIFIEANHMHTYLAQEIPWSWRGFSQSEALPLHSGLADLCDRPKCGRLGCVISGSGGLRSRYSLKNNKVI